MLMKQEGWDQRGGKADSSEKERQSLGTQPVYPVPQKKWAQWLFSTLLFIEDYRHPGPTQSQLSRMAPGIFKESQGTGMWSQDWEPLSQGSWGIRARKGQVRRAPVIRIWVTARGQGRLLLEWSWYGSGVGLRDVHKQAPFLFSNRVKETALWRKGHLDDWIDGTLNSDNALFHIRLHDVPFPLTMYMYLNVNIYLVLSCSREQVTFLCKTV